MVYKYVPLTACLFFLLSATNVFASVLKSFPSLSKHKTYFVQQLSRDMQPVWFPNRIPMNNPADYPGNQVSQTIKVGLLTGKPLPENFTAYYVLNHLVTVTKYNKTHGKPLIRDSEVLDLLFDGLQIKDEKIHLRVNEAVTEFLHPALKIKRKNEILKNMHIKPTEYEEMAKRKIPFSAADKIKIMENPSAYSEYVRFLAGDEALKKEAEDALQNAKDLRSFEHNARLLVDADPEQAAPILFKKINDPIYDSKDTGVSTKHVRSIVISLLGFIYPDDMLLNDDYELHIQYGSVFDNSLQKKRVSGQEVRHYIERVIQWGSKKFGINPEFQLEKNAFIERKNYPIETKDPQENRQNRNINVNKQIELERGLVHDSSMKVKFGEGHPKMRAFKIEKDGK